MRKSKYGVSPKAERTYNGTTYMSKLEMNYRKYLDLKIRTKLVQSYTEQVPFLIVVNGIKICTYKLDFKVIMNDKSVEYVDVKGVKTAIYSLKKKLVEAIFGIKIKEVKRGEFYTFTQMREKLF